MIDSFRTLFEETIKDMYSAEKQFLNALPKLAQSATDPDLRKTITDHIDQTEGHIERLARVAQMLGISPAGKACKAAQGIVEEAGENLSEGIPGPVLDACIILCAQKSEHYEICSYGTLVDWADELGLDDIQSILEETLSEEKDADKKLSHIASRGVNKGARKLGETQSGSAYVR